MVDIEKEKEALIKALFDKSGFEEITLTDAFIVSQDPNIYIECYYDHVNQTKTYRLKKVKPNE
jgi:hypothetical protein